MGIKRIVDISFWTDNKVDDFSPEDKYFMLYLLTNPFTTQLGIYEISIKQASFQMGYSVDAFNVLLDRFESKYDIIIYSKATGEIAIKNFLRHSIMKGGKPVEDCIKKEMSKVKDRRLIGEVFNYIKDKDDLNETVKKIINEYEIENHNDNDNEVSYHDSYNDSSSIPEKSSVKPKKPSKHKHGEYNNVLLTDSEFEKLTSDYGELLRDKAISFLDEYIEEKGYKSKSHNLAIRRWVIGAVQEKEQKGKPIRKEIVPDWLKKQKFNDFKQSTTDSQCDDMERKLRQELDPEYKARVEALKAELQEKYGKEG